MQFAAPMTEALPVWSRALFWLFLTAQFTLIGIGTWRLDPLILANGSPIHLNCAILGGIAYWNMPTYRYRFAWTTAVCIVAFAASIGLAWGSALAKDRVWVGYLGTQCLLCVLVGLDGMSWWLVDAIRRYRRTGVGDGQLSFTSSASHLEHLHRVGSPSSSTQLTPTSTLTTK
jgi:hypothetical protein